MYSKPIKVVYMFSCSFFLSRLVLSQSWPHSSRWLSVFAWAFFLPHCTSSAPAPSFSFFFFPQAAAIEAAAYIWKTRKMYTFLHKLFCSVCVAVVHSLLFISKLGSRVCCVRVTSPLQGKSKDCTWRKPQCTKMQGVYGSPFYTSFFVCRV